jgi:hypothetical protein
LWRYWIASKTFKKIKLTSLPIETTRWSRERERARKDIVSFVSLSDNYVLYIKFN